MAQSFEFQAKFGADLSDFNRQLNDAAGDVTKLAQVFKKFQADASDPIKTEVFVQLDGRDAISGKVQVVSNKLQGLDKDVRTIVTQLNKLSGAEKGSITQIKQQISALQQAINATRKGTANYKLLEQALKSTREEYNKAAGIQKGSVAALKQQIAEVERLSNAFRIGSAEQKRYQAELDILNGKLRGAQGSFTQFFGALRRVAEFQAGFVAITSAIQGITGSLNQFIGQAKQLEGFDLALRNIGLSAAQAGKALDDAGEIANGIGAPIEQVEKSFKRMVPALRAVGTNADDTNKFIEAISARTQTLGLNTEQSGRFMEAFAQVLSKGKLQSEELNQQISELDGAFRVQLADALGVSTEKLEDLIKTGKVTAPVFVKAVNQMENGVEALRGRVQAGNLTVQQLQNLIRNLSVKNLRTIGEALQPAIKAFFEIQYIFQQFIADVTESEFGQFLIESINGVVIGLKNFVVGFTEATKAVLVILDPIFAFLRAVNDLLRPLGGIVGILTTYTATVLTVKAAQQAYNLTLIVSKKTWQELNPLVDLATKGYKKLRAVTASLASINFAKNLKGTTKALKGKTKASYQAGQADEIAALAAEYLDPVLGKASGTYGKTATAAAGAATATKGVSLALGAAAAAAAVAVAALAIVFANYKYGEDQANKLSEAVKNLKKDLKDQGIVVKEQKDFWGRLGDGLAATGRDIARFFGSEKALIEGGIRGFKNYDAAIAEAFLSLNELGLNVYELDSIQRASNETLDTGVKRYQAVVDATKKQIATVEELIAKHREEGDFNYVKRVLEPRLKKLKETLPVEEQALKNIQREIELRREAAIASGEQLENLEDLEESIRRQNQEIENTKIEELTKNIQRYGKSSSDASKLVIANLATESIAREDQIDLIEKEISTAQRLYEQDKLTEEQRAEHATKQLERQGKILELERQRAEASNTLTETLLNNFERELLAGYRVADAYTKISQSLANASGSASSAVTSTLSQISSAIDLVTEREVGLLEEGDKRRRKLIADQISSQIFINNLETQIGITKNNIATRIAETELRVMQSRLRGEAVIARLRGDERGAKVLEIQAGSINDIIRLKKIENDLNNRGLLLNQRMQESQLIQKGVTEKIAGEFEDQRTQLIETEKLLGTSSISMGEISGAARQTGENLQQVEKIQGRIEESNQRALKASQEAPEKAKKSTQELAGAYQGANEGAQALRGTMNDIDKTTNKIVGNLREARSLLSGQNARWMGGPVEAGQTYRVNDAGLGREAFMNKFGNISMLPAGSNINWTAPSSGQIIPAAIVSQMRKNADLNSSIALKRNQDKPIASGAAISAQSNSSGNLVKQIQSALSGSNSNQRITNNVTIQSQQPVTDASEIMANVARMRLRGSRRI